jgi:membrane fusion protein (multidrug efflux system)
MWWTLLASSGNRRDSAMESRTAFSLLPAQNATGNFVKIVQRVPVKVVIDNPPTDVALGPGMSVVPSVRIDPRPSLYERLRAWV